MYYKYFSEERHRSEQNGTRPFGLLGAKDEGPAGPRMEGFYAGYFRDLDGNKLNVFCMTQPES